MDDVVMPLLPPGGLMEIVFSFDTTGSMSRAIEEVKGRVQDMIQRLQADIPGIRIGVIAHGDYCDKDVFYLEKHVDLSTNVVELCGLVKEVEGTGGGDPEECYEYVLRMVSGFGWTPGSQKALVMIGDATPHEPEYDLNVDNLDWREEARRLGDMGIKIYGVQAFDNADSTAFFEELISITSGQHVKLGQFSNICDLIMAICYREKGADFLQDYEAEVRAREKRMNKDMAGLFGTLKRGDSSASAKSVASDPSGVPGPLSRNSSVRSVSSVGSSGSARPNLKPVMSKYTSSIDRVAKNTAVGSPVRPNLKPAMSKYTSSIDRVAKNTAAGSPVRPNLKPAMSKYTSSIDRVAKNMAAGSPVRPNLKPAMSRYHSSINSVAKNTINASPKPRRSRRDKAVAKARNLVPDSDFVLQKGNLKYRWSNWRLAITDTEPKSTKQWTKRAGVAKTTKDKVGWRRTALFPWEPSNTRVMYEVAVQARKGGKMHVVYSKWSTLNAEVVTWERRLLSQRNVREEVESVLKQGCKVFVRRFETRRLGKNQKKALSDSRKMYSYAWPSLKMTVRNTSKSHKVLFE